MTDRIKAMIQTAAVYVPRGSEGIRVMYCEDDWFYGRGEDSGEEYCIHYITVDLDNDLIYGLVLLNP